MQGRQRVPAFELSVPEKFYREVEEVAGGEFADSYLYGAVLTDTRLVPRTQTAWMKLKENREVLDLLQIHGVRLVKPPVYDGPPAYETLGAEPQHKRRRAA